MPKRSHEDTEPVGQGCQEGGTALADPTILPGARRVLSPFLELFFHDFEDPKRDSEPSWLEDLRFNGRMPLMVVVGGGKPSYEMTAQESLSLLFEWLANPDEFARQAAMYVCPTENMTEEATCMRIALAYAAPNTEIIDALTECLRGSGNTELVLAEDICGKLVRLGTTGIQTLIWIAFEMEAKQIQWDGVRDTTVLAMTELLDPTFLGMQVLPPTTYYDGPYRCHHYPIRDVHENVVHLALEVLRSYVASCARRQPPQKPFASVAPAVFAALMTLFKAATEYDRVRESAMHLLNDMATHSVEFCRILRSRRADVRFVLDDVLAQNKSRYANGTIESVLKLAAVQVATLTTMATVAQKLTEDD
jgi:hypothetical protein